MSSFVADHIQGNNFDDGQPHPNSKVGRKRPLRAVASLFTFKSISKKSVYWAACSTAIILLLLQSSGVFNQRTILGTGPGTRETNSDSPDISARPVPPLSDHEMAQPLPESLPERRARDSKNIAPGSPPFPEPSRPPADVERQGIAEQDQEHPSLPKSASSPAPVPSPEVAGKAKDKSQQYPSHHRSNRMKPPNEEPSQGSHDDVEEQEFFSWCRLALGIETSLEIQTFQYYDYMKALPDQDWEQDDASSDDDWQGKQATASLPMIAVRGLAATRDIVVGEVVIRIPLQALFSVTTTIDKDPVLGPVIGLEARQRRGWDLDAPPKPSAVSDDTSPADDEGMSPTLLEIPLLAVALLHHKRLGSSSSLAPYIRVLNRTPVDTIPFLWNKPKLRTLSEGIRTVARGVKRDMKAMYERVVKVLITEHPQVFDNGAFTYENFEWAFAIVNSRHWQLPVVDMQGSPAAAQASQRRMHPQHETRTADENKLDQQLPPADMPTDAWVDATKHQQGQPPDAPNDVAAGAIPKHSFLAPLADLLNFGPPCTTGSYNRDAHTFEIVASCEFRKGQEVTFWYSDECDHVMVGLYGFMHPMIPPCPSAEEYKRASEEWRRRAEELDTQLAESNQDLYRLDREASHLVKLLKDCDCQRYKDEIKAREEQDRVHKAGTAAHGDMEPSRLRHEHVRGGIADREDLERRGVRKATRERDTEF